MRRLTIVLLWFLSHFISLSPHSLNLAPAERNQTVSEGLIAGTKVKTIQGYTNIEDLNTHDIVIAYNHDHATCYQARVLDIDQAIVPGFVKVTVGNETIHVAAHQQFYIPDKKQWVKAEDLCAGDLLCSTISSYVPVNSIEYVHQPITAYKITVEHHYLCITSADILVHNFDPVSSSAAYTAGALVSGTNPVGAPIIGTIITATAIGLAVYKTWHSWSGKHRICPEEPNDLTTFIPSGLPEFGLSKHIHYAQKEKALNTKQEKEQKANKEQPEAFQKTVIFSGNGNDDPNDDDDDKDFFKKLKARANKKARSVRFGKMYRDPKTNLWWSKDRACHAGSHYKVFKEGARGFEWEFDANAQGQKIIGKHKGPIGLFIPYKEIIFL